MIQIMHAHAVRGHDCYETPEVATQALLAVESLPARIWEPACGPGAIVRVLRKAGHEVVATDLIDYGSVDQDRGGIDFLDQRTVPKGVTCICTNPPFRDCESFVRHALDLGVEKIVML